MKSEISNNFTPINELNIKLDISEKIVIRLDKKIMELEQEKYLLESQKGKYDDILKKLKELNCVNNILRKRFSSIEKKTK